MYYLTDTHVLLWAVITPEKLSGAVWDILENERNVVYYSPVNLWEISIKYGIDKLKLGGVNPEKFFTEVENSDYVCLPLSNSDVITNYKLPLRHKDPFDRLLIWTALRNNLTFLTVDRTTARYAKDGLKCVW
jgi:PIN domain nuclease of toxin-antitoxin system